MISVFYPTLLTTEQKTNISYMYLFKSGTASQLGDVAHGHLILVYVFYGSFCYACISRCIEF